MTTPLVRIVDDDADARSSSSFFLSMMGLEIKEYDSAYRFLEEDDMNRPGCIILDVRMPDMTGMELQVKLNQKDCRLPIIFLSGHGELDMAVHALKRGASDFLQKSAKPERLLAAVKKAVTASMEEYESGNEIETLRKIYDSLTPREKEVVLGVAKGELNKVIGYNLGISERTVKMHRANLCSTRPHHRLYFPAGPYRLQRLCEVAGGPEAPRLFRRQLSGYDPGGPSG